jgi:hypothetical protein
VENNRTNASALALAHGNVAADVARVQAHAAMKRATSLTELYVRTWSYFQQTIRACVEPPSVASCAFARATSSNLTAAFDDWAQFPREVRVGTFVVSVVGVVGVGVGVGVGVFAIYICEFCPFPAEFGAFWMCCRAETRYV